MNTYKIGPDQLYSVSGGTVKAIPAGTYSLAELQQRAPIFFSRREFEGAPR